MTRAKSYGIICGGDSAQAASGLAIEDMAGPLLACFLLAAPLHYFLTLRMWIRLRLYLTSTLFLAYRD